MVEYWPPVNVSDEYGEDPENLIGEVESETDILDQDSGKSNKRKSKKQKKESNFTF